MSEQLRERSSSLLSPIAPVSAPVQPAASGKTVEDVGKLAASAIAVLVFLWSVVRYLLRPLLDETVLNALRRKSPEVREFMKADVFATEFTERESLKATVAATAASVAALAADTAHVHQQVSAATTLLASIPHLAGAMESMATEMRDMRGDVWRFHDIVRDHAERIGAAVGVDEGGRRHEARRRTDPPPSDGAAPGDGATHLLPLPDAIHTTDPARRAERRGDDPAGTR